jgi:hypothetical protein
MRAKRIANQYIVSPELFFSTLSPRIKDARIITAESKDKRIE